jgi:phospho-N-acetylmuramoyl-pentapeptide-transferase
VFRYITFRTGGAIMTALFFVFLFGPKIISSLGYARGMGQPIRADGPQTHFLKAGHADHGRADDPVRHRRLGAAVGDLSSVYVWVAAGDARLRR